MGQANLESVTGDNGRALSDLGLTSCLKKCRDHPLYLPNSVPCAGASPANPAPRPGSGVPWLCATAARAGAGLVSS